MQHANFLSVKIDDRYCNCTRTVQYTEYSMYVRTSQYFTVNY